MTVLVLRMGRFRLVFACWFIVLLACFAFANMTTLQQPTSLKPFGGVGFPVRFAAWGAFVESSFDWFVLALNLLVAVVVSALIAWACAGSRHRPISPRRLKLLLVLALVPAVALVHLCLADWHVYIGHGEGRRVKFPHPLWYQFVESGIVGVGVGGLLAMAIAFFWPNRTR